MEKNEIEQIIFEALELANQSRKSTEKIMIAPNAKLFGKDGQLDSMALVALLIDIEDALQDRGYQITLSDERAMSLIRSPFEDVPSLTEFVAGRLLEEQVDES
jgi:acyl carrier protein